MLEIFLIVCSFPLIIILISKRIESTRKRKLLEIAGETAIYGEAAKSLTTTKMRIRAENRAKGIVGELGIANELEELAKIYGLTVLHDLSIPGSKANIDHLLIARGAIFVIDVKNYSGLVRIVKDKNGEKHLYVGRYKQTPLVLKVKKYAEAVAYFLQGEEIKMKVVPLLAFHNGTFKENTSFHVDGVTINAAGIENELLRFATGKNSSLDIADVAARILRHFPHKN